jgi:hypothetical protein
VGKLGVREKSLIHATPLMRASGVPVPGFGTGFLPFGNSVDLSDDAVEGVPGGVGNFNNRPSSTLTQDHIFVGNGSNVPTDVPMTGDASIVASGAITLAAGQRRYRGTASGTNTYTVTTSPTHTAYSAGDLLTITFTNANTGASTLNDNSLGAKAIQYKGAALTGGEIPAGATVELLYDGTQFQIVGVIGSSASSSSDFLVYTICGGAL